MAEARNVLVTGGTSGLGRAIATGFAAAGHAVMICARTAADCTRVAAEISDGNPGACIGLPCDLGSNAAIERLAEEVGARFGVLHALVNNAGAVAPGPLQAIGEADWDRVADTNLKAAFFMTQKMAPYLGRAATADWPACVINIGSFAGSRVSGQPHYAYSAAKAGLNLLTQALAKGLAGDHVNVNTIALGVFPEDSGMLRNYDAETLDMIRRTIPAGRLGMAKDIVALTGFLASAASSYITGATIPLDGGMHI